MKKLFLLLTALAVLVSGKAFAGATDIVTLADGTCYNTATHQRVDCTTGAVWTQEFYKDRDNWTLISSFSDTVQTGTGLGVKQFAQLQWTAESTLVAPSYAYRRMWLAVRVVPAAGDTTFKTYLAIQVRAHTAALADSDNTFAWYGWATTGASAVTVADSLGQFFKGTTPVQGGGNPQIAGPGEKLFVFQPGAGYGGILSAGGLFSWPNGIWTPLVDQRGVWFGAPYVSVRARMLWGTGPVKVILKLYGAS